MASHTRSSIEYLMPTDNIPMFLLLFVILRENSIASFAGSIRVILFAPPLRQWLTFSGYLYTASAIHRVLLLACYAPPCIVSVNSKCILFVDTTLFVCPLSASFNYTLRAKKTVCRSSTSHLVTSVSEGVQKKGWWQYIRKKSVFLIH